MVRFFVLRTVVSEMAGVEVDVAFDVAVDAETEAGAPTGIDLAFACEAVVSHGTYILPIL